MRACASTSKLAAIALAIAMVWAYSLRRAHANEPPPPVSVENPAGQGESSGGRTQQPEDDDYRQTPYTSFGEFNDEEEAEDTRFFQYGRFFGVSLGLGYEGATGNRGSLYSGGLPAFELRVHYWFDFNFALTLGIYSAKHQYSGTRLDLPEGESQKNDFNLFKYGAELRYYFETRDATAAVTFAGPFLIGGIGNFTKSESNLSSPGEIARDSALGFTFGAGLEFPLKPRKSYLNLETKFHAVSFNDTGLSVTTPGGRVVENTSGLFFTVLGSILFTY